MINSRSTLWISTLNFKNLHKLLLCPIGSIWTHIENPQFRWWDGIGVCLNPFLIRGLPFGGLGGFFR